VPDETVRVMVGRLEIMRPEDETRVTALVQKSAADRAAAERERADGADVAPYKLPEAIVQLGRLSEPALVRVQNIAADQGTQVEAGLLLRQLQQLRNSQAAAAQ
jgi:hypothetical protein